MRLKIPFLIPRDAQSGFAKQNTTDHELWDGPPPDRIERIATYSRGYIGPNSNTFPMTGGLQYIGHVPLAQVSRGPMLQPGNAIDDRAFVPAIFAGNPVQ